MNLQQIYPFVPLFKTLLTTVSTVPTEEEAHSPAYLARTAKSNDITQLNELMVGLLFYNQREWFGQEDTWVAEALVEWTDRETEILFETYLKEDASQTDLEKFIEDFGKIAERWRTESEQAQPQPNPDFDPEDPVEGTQYYKYAKIPGTEEFQWLYGPSPESDDWQSMDVRYAAYEALLPAPGATGEGAGLIEPYGEYFMKLVDGAWRYGCTRESEYWYGDYEEMLRAEGLAPAVPAAPAPAPVETEAEAAATAPEEIREYGEYFIKLVDGAWHYGRTRESELWYEDYEEMLRAEGLAPSAPVSVAETVEEFEKLLQPSEEEARDLGPDALDALAEAGDEFAALFAEALQDPTVAALAAQLSEEHRALAAIEIADRVSDPA
jgi:hypothetical protein